MFAAAATLVEFRQEVAAMSLLSYYFRASARADLANAMFRRLGVLDWFAADPARAVALRRAVMRCAGCSHEAECTAWLQLDEGGRHAPDFCRNHDLVERILNQKQDVSV
jgi:hypothetical protein